jgi:hypothetical protein
MKFIDCGGNSPGCAVLFIIAGLVAAIAAAAPADLSYSPDTHLLLNTSVGAADEDVVSDDLNGTVARLDLGPLPPSVAVDGFHRIDADNVLFSLDSTAVLGTIVVRPGDIVGYDGNNYSLRFEAASAGLAAGVNVTSVTMLGADLVMSFDTTLVLDNIRFSDEDLARYDGNTFSRLLDGSAAGIAAGLALDGSEVLSDGRILLSFDSFGRVTGDVLFADEDVLEYSPATLSWERVFDSSAALAAWTGVDMEALAGTMIRWPALSCLLFRC